MGHASPRQGMHCRLNRLTDEKSLVDGEPTPAEIPLRLWRKHAGEVRVIEKRCCPAGLDVVAAELDDDFGVESSIEF